MSGDSIAVPGLLIVRPTYIYNEQMYVVMTVNLREFSDGKRVNFQIDNLSGSLHDLSSMFLQGRERRRKKFFIKILRVFRK